MRGRRASLLIALLAAGSACSAIIGIKDLTPGGPDEGDAAPADGSSSGDATSDAAFDAPADGTVGCAHDCSGGACIAGRCTPVPLTSSEVSIAELRVAGDLVLYRAGSQVRTVPLLGGALPSVIVPCANRAGLDVTAVGFYSWCNTSLTLRNFADAGVIASSSIDGYGAAAGGGWLLFGRNTSELNRILSTLGDGGFIPVTTTAVGYRAWAATSTQLFYMLSDGTLFYGPIGSGTPTLLESAQTNPSTIAADDTAVVWATDSDTNQAILHTRNVKAPQSRELARRLDHPIGVALDADYVYVTMRGNPPDYSDGAIARVGRGVLDGPLEILADGQLSPHDIVVTDSFVLWTSLGTSTDAGYAGGAIYRLAK